MWRTCEHVSRPCIPCSFFPCALDLRGSVGFFCRGILKLDKLCSTVLSSMMLFKRSFALTRSLFILHVHEHDRLGFGMLTVETAVIAFVDFNSSNCDRKGQSYPVEYYLESVEEYSEGKIHMSEPESGKGNVNTVYFVNQARGNTRISRTEFVYDE